MSTTRLYFVHARSPLHAGTGQATSAVDLPIARDRATHLPLLPGSSVKGSLRTRARHRPASEQGDWLRVFGPEAAHASDHAGAIAITDARLLVLPVRSVAGTFAWVTAPYLLACLSRDAEAAGQKPLPRLPTQAQGEALVTADTLLGVEVDKKSKVVLEELDLDRKNGAEDLARRLGAMIFPKSPEWADLLRRRLCVVHDDVMSFLGDHGTEIVTRVSIDPATGTAKGGQLWTEENLPAESVLVGLMEELPVGSSQPPLSPLQRVERDLLAEPIQLGGKSTVGRGRCQIHLLGGGA